MVYLCNKILFRQKWNEVLTHTTTWINFEKMLSIRRQIQKILQYNVSFDIYELADL